MAMRDAYQAKLKANLDKMDAELRLLKAKAANATADVRIGLNTELLILKAQRQIAKARLAQMKRASDKAWDDIKDAADVAWKELSAGFKAARRRFK